MGLMSWASCNAPAAFVCLLSLTFYFFLPLNTLLKKSGDFSHLKSWLQSLHPERPHSKLASATALPDFQSAKDTLELRDWSGKRRSALEDIEKCKTEPDAHLSRGDFGSTTLAWKPQDGKYLFAICRYGRISNQQICLRKHLWFAVLLNRTLLLPRFCFHGGYFPWSHPTLWTDQYNLEATESCARRDGDANTTRYIMSEVEYLALHNESCLRVDRPLLLTGKWEPQRHINSMQWFFGKNCSSISNFTHDPPLTDSWDVSLEVLEQLQKIEEPVMTLGTLYLERVKGYDLDSPVAPLQLAEGCLDFWVPSASVETTTKKVMAKLETEGEYASLHLRRADFKDVYGNHPGHPSYLAMPEVAQRVTKWLAPLQVSALYIASDAKATELQNLEELLKDLRKDNPLRCITLRSFDLDIEQEMKDLEGEIKGVVLAAVEKEVCARAKAFLGTPESTYSKEVQRMRIAKGKAHCRDATFAEIRPS